MTMCDSTKKAALPDGMVFAIKDWNHNFEVSQSKRVKNGRSLTWVAMPTKHDGKGLRRILRGCSKDDRSVLGEYSETHQQILVCGPALYGVWCLLVQLAAKMPTRGVFMDEDGALTAEDLADSIGIDPTYVKTTISFCLGERMKWIQLISLNEDCNTRSTLGADSEQTRRTVDRSVPTGQDRTGQDRTISPLPPSGGNEVVVSKEKRISKAQMEKLKYEDFPGFEVWWQAYPNPTGKRKAFEVWVRRNLEDEDQECLLKVLAIHCALPEWRKDGGSFVPHGATYLNQRRDEDVPEELKVSLGLKLMQGPKIERPRGPSSDLPPSVSYDPESCKSDDGTELAQRRREACEASRVRAQKRGEV